MKYDNDRLGAALKMYLGTQPLPMHMPGHKRNTDVISDIFSRDITEISGLDNLHSPSGLLKDLEDAAAEVSEDEYTAESADPEEEAGESEEDMSDPEPEEVVKEPEEVKTEQEDKAEEDAADLAMDAVISGIDEDTLPGETEAADPAQPAQADENL